MGTPELSRGLLTCFSLLEAVLSALWLRGDRSINILAFSEDSSLTR